MGALRLAGLVALCLARPYQAGRLAMEFSSPGCRSWVARRKVTTLIKVTPLPDGVACVTSILMYLIFDDFSP